MISDDFSITPCLKWSVFLWEEKILCSHPFSWGRGFGSAKESDACRKGELTGLPSLSLVTLENGFRETRLLRIVMLKSVKEKQPRWKANSCSFLQNFPYNLAMAFPWYLPNKLKTLCSHKSICVQVFRTALFTVAKTWKQTNALEEVNG